MRGLTQAALAERMQFRLSASAISQLEKGDIKPSSQSLGWLADALELPETYFVKSAPMPDGFFRSLRKTPVGTRRRALVTASMLHDLVDAVERYVELPTFDIARSEVRHTEAQVAAIALETRLALGLGTGPIPNMVAVLENHGVIVGRLHLADQTDITKGQPSTVDAFSIPYVDHPVVILAEDKGKVARSRFDAAHELGHLVMHDSSSAGSKEVERQAQWFAAEFLMPAEVIRQELPHRVNWRQLLDIKLRWGVSLGALLMRAKTLGHLDDQAYLNAIKMMSANGWRIHEPGDDEMGPVESPRLLNEAIQFLAAEGISLDQIVADACLSMDDVKSLVGSDERRHRLPRFTKG